MEVRQLDSKGRAVELVPRSEEDLWTLAMAIRKGDLIRTVVMRDVSGKDAKSKERRPIEVLLRVESVEFQPFTGVLRVFGVIEEGPEKFGVKGKHQSAYLGLNQRVTLIRESGWDRKTIEKLMSSGPRGKAMIVAVDYDSYAMALLTPLGLKVLYEGNLSLGAKDDPRRQESLEKAINEIAEGAVKHAAEEGVAVIVIAGPVTLKDEVANKVKQMARSFNIITDSTSSGGLEGIYEVLRRQSVIDALKEISSVRAQEVMDEFMKLFSTDRDMVAYTLDDVLEASNYGAVKSMIILDELLYSINDDEREKAQRAVELAETRGGEVIIITSETPVSTTVSSFGGVVATLRFRLPREIKQ